MTPRRQRMLFVGVILIGVAVAAALAFRAIGENMLFFFSPSDIEAGDVPPGQTVRIGGLVVNGSVKRRSGELAVRFDLTDNASTVTVQFAGLLPDLFREGQGIVAMGKLDPGGIFAAEEVLAKHDENYMPPEVAEALKAAQPPGASPPSGGASPNPVLPNPVLPN